MIETRGLIITILWVTLGLLILFIIVYRVILRRFKRDRIEKELYLKMHPIERQPAYGTVPIFIETHTPMDVEVSVFSPNMETHKIIVNESLKKGGNIIQLDTTEFENGIYFYQAKTANQKTKKRIEIKN